MIFLFKRNFNGRINADNFPKNRYYNLGKYFYCYIMLIKIIMAYPCNDSIYCHGQILDTIQRMGMFSDSKQFVDMPTKKPRKEVIETWNKMGNEPTLRTIEEFLETQFHKAGHEILMANIEKDWNPNPTFLNSKSLSLPILFPFHISSFFLLLLSFSFPLTLFSVFFLSITFHFILFFRYSR